MAYTVGEMTKMLEVPASTLRYYDKDGLLPFVERFRSVRGELRSAPGTDRNSKETEGEIA